MKKDRIKGTVLALITAALLGMELLLLTDTVIVFFGRLTSPAQACLLWAGWTVAVGILLRWKPRKLLKLSGMIPGVLAVLAVCGMLLWYSFSTDAGYEFSDEGKERFYGDRKVMLIVPHQDDDLNILTGVLEEYTRYGSQLYPVFVTNGDYVKPAWQRYQEALTVYRQLNVPEEQVFFLGYGDGWQEGSPHIYNSVPGTAMVSYAGKTETYGTQSHPAFREGRAYTIDHLMEDLKSVILQVQPEIIFCSDYDHHIDHKALTLLFEKVMGQILKENPDYQPVVYKAYAYSTAWEAEPDYYDDNVASTRNPFEPPISQTPQIYRWEERTRFPVSRAGLSRSLVTSRGYEQLKIHKSQGAQLMAAAVINGDKVAWQRRTDSLCLQAQMAVSSGNGSLLNDFMLLENADLRDEERMPYDGVWIPAQSDREGTVEVTLAEPSDLYTVVLYDHPSKEDNVLNAEIVFDDGTVIETGPLDPYGAATSIVVGKEQVSSFRVVLKQTEGAQAGLSELEAFAGPQKVDGTFVKLTDGAGNFLYDYQMDSDGTAELFLYTHGGLPQTMNWQLSVDSTLASARWEDGHIRVSCPEGESLTLTVSQEEVGISDSILIRNPGKWSRFWTSLWQGVEESLFARYSRQAQKDLLIPASLKKISYVLRHLG